MRKISYLNIHNLLSVAIHHQEELNWFPELNQPMRFFQVDQIKGDPEIIMEIGDFQPQIKNCFIVDHKYYIRQNYFFCDDSFKGLKWRVEFHGFEEGPTRVKLHIQKMDMKYHLTPGIIYNGLFLRQLIAYHLIRKGACLIHAGACAKDGKAVVFFGRGGTYKTTHIIQFMRQSRGWNFMGDDTLILSGKHVLSFPYSLSFFGYRYANLPDEQLSVLDRFRIFPYSKKFNPSSIGVEKQAEIVALINCSVGVGIPLNFHPADGEASIRDLARQSAVDDYTNASIGHTQTYPKYVEAYSLVFPENGLSKRWQEVMKQMTCLSSIKPYHLEVPVDFLDHLGGLGKNNVYKQIDSVIKVA